MYWKKSWEKDLKEFPSGREIRRLLHDTQIFSLFNSVQDLWVHLKITSFRSQIETCKTSNISKNSLLETLTIWNSRTALKSPELLCGLINSPNEKCPCLVSPECYSLCPLKRFMCCFAGLNSFKIRLKEWFYITQFRKKESDLLRHFGEFTSFCIDPGIHCTEHKKRSELASCAASFDPISI